MTGRLPSWVNVTRSGTTSPCATAPSDRARVRRRSANRASGRLPLGPASTVPKPTVIVSPAMIASTSFARMNPPQTASRRQGHCRAFDRSWQGGAENRAKHLNLLAIRVDPLILRAFVDHTGRHEGPWRKSEPSIAFEDLTKRLLARGK